MDQLKKMSEKEFEIILTCKVLKTSYFNYSSAKAEPHSEKRVLNIFI